LKVLGIIGFALVINGLAIAQTSENQISKKLVDLSLSDGKTGNLQLKVNQMTLAQALGAIADKTNTPIHHAKLPEDLVTVVCKGPSLKQVLECLVGKKADLVLRYSRNQDKAGTKGQIAEAWVLGKPATHTQTNPVLSVAETDQRPIKQDLEDQRTRVDRTDELLTKAHSYKPGERAKALAALLGAGRKNDLLVKAALEQALTDEDDYVRAQAISSLAHREGNSATPELQQALQDASEDVRLMAVEGISDDVALLQQALNDSDESIRSLAETKLELLVQDQNNGAK
jgi:hypothetical protein